MNSDELAAVRTHLANERTLLAYVRTALAFLATGAGLIHFFVSVLARAAGWTFLALGVVTFAVGIGRFVQVRQRMGQGRA